MFDGLIAPIWLAINVLLVVTAWQWSRRLFPADPAVFILVHSLIFSWACIVLVATLLSLVFLLTGGWLLFFVGTIATIARLPLKRQADSPNVLPVSTIQRLILYGWIIQVGFWSGHVISSGLGTFPMNWDDLNYHLPLVDHWLQARSLYAPHCDQWTNPGNNEVLAVWITGAFSGDFLAVLTNLLPTVLLACSSVALGLELGMSRAVAHVSAFAIVSNSIIRSQLINNENDVAVAACFFAALLYAFRSARTASRYHLALGAIALGLLGGIKFYAAGYALVAFVALVLLSGGMNGRRGFCGAFVFGAAGILMWSGYWYLRNLLITGSPVYPKEFFIYPDMLTRIHPHVASTSFLGNGSTQLMPLFVEAIWAMAGPVPTIAFMAMPLTMAWIVGLDSLRPGRSPRPVCVRVTLAWLIIGTGLILATTPFAVEDIPGTLNQLRRHYCPVRYGTCLLDTVTLLLMYVLDDLLCSCQPYLTGSALSRFRRRFHLGFKGMVLLGIVLCGACFQTLGHARGRFDSWFAIFFAINLTLLMHTLLTVAEKWPYLVSKAIRCLGLLLMLASAFLVARMSAQWH